MNEELKEQLQNQANKWKIPIILKENISISKDLAVLPMSDGNELHIFVDVQPYVVEDNKIVVDFDLKMAQHKSFEVPKEDTPEQREAIQDMKSLGPTHENLE